MRLVGFIKELNQIDGAKSLEEVRNCQREQLFFGKILTYLSKGEILTGFMGYVTDPETDKLITPDAYLTDGEWVWPSYLPYYLKKYPKMQLNDEFIEYLKRKDFKFRLPENFTSKRDEMERILIEKLDGK